MGVEVPSTHPARILVRCPNHLGDVVMSTPGLAALRAAHPTAQIVALLPRALAPLLAGTNLVDAVWPLVESGGRLARLRAEAERIAVHDFALGIAIPESISAALSMRLGRVARIVGFARDPLRAALLDRRVAAPAEWGRRRLVSRERFVLRLMEAVGAPPLVGAPRLRLATTQAEEERLEAALRAVATSIASLVGDPPVVFAPGAGYGVAKCWPVESFAVLADRMAAAGLRVAIVGGPGESERIQAMRSAMRAPALVFDAALDLGALKALLRRARLLVANDAGTRHVAAAFAVPSVVFFGPTSVAKTPDNLERVEVLERAHACRPCYLRRCPIDHRCLRRITIDDARAGAERALARGEGTAAARSAPQSPPPAAPGAGGACSN